MTISEDLIPLQNIKIDIRNAVQSKSIVVPTTAGFNKYAEYISNIRSDITVRKKKTMQGGIISSALTSIKGIGSGVRAIVTSNTAQTTKGSMYLIVSSDTQTLYEGVDNLTSNLQYIPYAILTYTPTNGTSPVITGYLSVVTTNSGISFNHAVMQSNGYRVLLEADVEYDITLQPLIVFRSSIGSFIGSNPTLNNAVLGLKSSINVVETITSGGYTSSTILQGIDNTFTIPRRVLSMMDAGVITHYSYGDKYILGSATDFILYQVGTSVATGASTTWINA